MKVKRSELDRFCKEFLMTSIDYFNSPGKAEVFASIPVAEINRIYSAGFRAGIDALSAVYFLSDPDRTKKINEWYKSGADLELEDDTKSGAV